MLSSKEIRKQFIEFFESKQHKAVPSAPVIPIDDPTLLFTNAGMNQFKNIFLGQVEPKYPRVVDTQKCIRAGGKHNDLDEVGRDGYHHTFFEMLGNWSFGDYYKKEAIIWAWELLTAAWKLPKDLLYATVHNSDEDAFNLWKSETDIEPTHIEYHDDKDNFWKMGNTGPCGPCSEIHIDRGIEFCNMQDDPNHTCIVNGDCHRYIELWNLVFIQFNSEEDGTLLPLKNKYVDTGAGFERICQVLQNKDSNYHTDLFMPLIERIEQISGIKYHKDDRGTSHRVIADHVRALCFALADGGLPSNEGRGYVLRRILRRAARHGHLLGMKKPFQYDLIDTVIEIMGEHFSELKEKQSHIKMIIKAEEERFIETLDNGLSKFQEYKTNLFKNMIIETERIMNNPEFKKMVTETEKQLNDETYRKKFAETEKHMNSEAYRNMITETEKIMNDPNFMKMITETEKHLNDETYRKMITKTEEALKNDFLFNELIKQDSFKIPGSEAFMLYDTYGFPLDLTKIMAEEKGLTVDEEGFQKEMEKQKQRAREAGKFELKLDDTDWTELLPTTETEFLGYTGTYSKTHIQKYHIDAENNVKIVLDRTPFYAESGGQVGDSGKIYNKNCEILITDVKKDNDVFIHLGKLIKGEISKDQFTAEINIENRKSIARNHTATHLLHKALRDVLGDHVQQKGSLVHPDHLRFDFTHFQQVSKHELDIIERAVNAKVRECQALNTEIKSIEEAKKAGAMALFGEKYGENVRVVTIGNYSKELCGGTHLSFTGEIGFFKITSESSIAAGIRRIEAITGEKAEQYIKLMENEIDEIGRHLNAPASGVMEKIEKMLAENKKLHIQMKAIRVKSAGSALDDMISKAIDVNGVKLVVAKVNIPNPSMLRPIGDQLRDKLKSGIGVLFSDVGGKVSILVIVTKDLTQQYHAGKIIGKVAELVGGKGGGRPDMAMAGGKDVNEIQNAMKKVKDIISDQ